MSAYSDKVIADGATAYWRLNEPSGTTANSLVGSLPGTISGGVTLNQPGALADGDKAMLFNGVDGKITTAAWPFPAAFTIEAWVKTTFQTTYQGVLSNRTAGGGVTVGIFTDGSPYFFDSTGGSRPGVPGTIRDGKWHHLVWTWVASALQLFVDGQLNAAPTVSSGTRTNPVSIGVDSQDPKYFNGSLDDVAIYATALTSAQVSAHYALGVSSAQPFDGRPRLIATRWLPVTPSDTLDGPPMSALWVGQGGDVSAVMPNGQAGTFSGVTAGSVLPLAIRRVNATGTTAANLVALSR